MSLPDPETNLAAVESKNCMISALAGVLDLEHWLLGKYQENGVSNGWRTVSSNDEEFILYVMSQLLYNKNAGPNDPLFDMSDPQDRARIYWCQSRPVAFYTVKPKGTMSVVSREVYQTDTLDTAYVLPSFRRQGIGLSMLKDFAECCQGGHLAISTPISNSMAYVIHKFLETKPCHRMKLWEVDGAGTPGNKKLLCFSLKGRIRSV